MTYERMRMKNKLKYLETLAAKHSKEVYSSRVDSMHLEELVCEMSEGMRKLWDRIDALCETILNLRDKAIDGFKDSEGHDGYKAIADLAQEALDMMIDTGSVREDLKNDKD